MRSLSLLLTVVVSPLCASVISVGPINLSGGGTLSDPDYASYGGEGLAGLGLILHASGTNGNDSISIDTRDIELTPSDANYFQDLGLTNLVFDAGLSQCAVGLSQLADFCNVSIDGITGYGSFTNLGGGNGIVQVFGMVGTPQFPYPGPLLAQAQVFSAAEIMSVTYGLGGSYCPTCPAGTGSSLATFAILPVPEPATGLLGLVAIAALAYLFVRKTFA